MMALSSLAVGEEVLDLEVTHTREQIKAYANASGDQNPIHQDDEIARAVGLPGVIAHGMLNYGLLSRAVTDWLGDPGRLRRLTVRFSNMVQPGDTVRCRGRVKNIDEAAGRAVLEVWMENQLGEKVLSHAEAEISTKEY
jgi:acyl dehydratase